MRKRDKVKAFQLANKRILGESLDDSGIIDNQFDRLNAIRNSLNMMNTEPSINEPTIDNLETPVTGDRMCEQAARRVFEDFGIDGDFESFYSEYFG